LNNPDAKPAGNQKEIKFQKALKSEADHRSGKARIKNKKASEESSYAVKIEKKIGELDDMKEEYRKKLDSETDYKKLCEILDAINAIDNDINHLMEEWMKFSN